ncbi:hypothetical protein VPIG_00009 [Vibrio phage PWH3a-P1]|uniref:hypothetical protein n=1 Tax=Vibrio phage PWH3a-P1 TaxID=754058 RepID=UPI0002C0EE2F|nr:hypothetical protein VPIG_00009 [Vibrio phage PWH3a-P1]AGH31867.1 hypothetical protein VPIG_00009 [Vibrio phage PWH3a-P1]
MKHEELNKYITTPVLEGEVWVPIKCWEGIYEISNKGRVKRLSFTRINSNQTSSWEQHYPEAIYRLNLDSSGYPQVCLKFDGRSRRVARCHRLVAEHFLIPPSQDLIQECKNAGLDYVPVEHEDDDTTNPDLRNLRWCSPSFNNKKASSKMDYSFINGSNQVNSKLVEKDVDEILDLLSAGLAQQRIADMFGVKQITISNIKTGRSWAHYTGIKKTPRTRKRKPKSIMEREEINND